MVHVASLLEREGEVLRSPSAQWDPLWSLISFLLSIIGLAVPYQGKDPPILWCSVSGISLYFTVLYEANNSNGHIYIIHNVLQHSAVILSQVSSPPCYRWDTIRPNLTLNCRHLTEWKTSN